MSGRVTDRDSGEVVEYDTATGINYDREGFAVVVTGSREDGETAIAVWAPGTWRHADLDVPDSAP